MSATDLREALERIASFVASSDAHAARCFPQLQAIARQALDAVPAEPEAWEYGFGLPDDDDPYGRCGSLSDAQALLSAMTAGYQSKAQIVRRRPGTAPGEWERVDPEPRPQD